MKREIHKQGFSGQCAIQKPIIDDSNSYKRKTCFRSRKTWTIKKSKAVIWSDESCSHCFQLLPDFASGDAVLTDNSDCLLRRVKHAGVRSWFGQPFHDIPWAPWIFHKVAFLGRIMWRIRPIMPIPWYDVCSLKAMLCSKTTTPLFKYFGKGTGHPGLVLWEWEWFVASSLATTVREMCVIVIQPHHRYLNLPPFSRKYIIRFPWKP